MATRIQRIKKALGKKARRRKNTRAANMPTESLEQRQLLSGVMANGSEADAAVGRVYFEVQDQDGSGSLSVGESFELVAKIQDLRGEAALGIHAAYLDLTYDTDLVDFTSIQHHMPTSTQGEIQDEQGLINEVGGARWTLMGDQSEPQLLFTLSGVATAAGEITFIASPGDDPFTEFIAGGIDEDVRDSFRFEDFSITVAGEGTVELSDATLLGSTLEVDYQVVGGDATPFELIFEQHQDGGSTVVDTIQVATTDQLSEGDSTFSLDLNLLSGDQRAALEESLSDPTTFFSVRIDSADQPAIRIQGGVLGDNGTLYVLGSDSNDNIEVTGSTVALEVSANTIDLSLFAVERIDIRSFDGDDFVDAELSVLPVTVHAAAGNDEVIGGQANDVLDGGIGNDVLEGGRGADVLLGDMGNDTVLGGAGNDFILGAAGDDQLDGGDGDDVLKGQGSADSLTGGLGNDRIDGGGGGDTVIESGDVDFAATQTSMTGLGVDSLKGIEKLEFTGGAGDNLIDASSFSGVSTLRGGAGNDFIVGTFTADLLYGQDGDDTVRGGAAQDWIEGGDGIDFLYGETGTDRLWGQNGDDQLFGAEDYDILMGEDGNDILHGGDDRDIIRGGMGNDKMYGEGGNDLMFGGAGKDLMVGADGNDLMKGQGSSNDTMSGGRGNDKIDGGAGNDILEERGDADFTLMNGWMRGMGNDRIVGIERARLFGGDGDNRIDASQFNGLTTIAGGEGNDTIVGTDQIDYLFGEAGDDVLQALNGNDWLDGGEGNDQFEGGTGTDTINGGNGLDRVNGHEEQDQSKDTEEFSSNGENSLANQPGKAEAVVPTPTAPSRVGQLLQESNADKSISPASQTPAPSTGAPSRLGTIASEQAQATQNRVTRTTSSGGAPSRLTSIANEQAQATENRVTRSTSTGGAPSRASQVSQSTATNQNRILRSRTSTGTASRVATTRSSSAIANNSRMRRSTTSGGTSSRVSSVLQSRSRTTSTRTSSGTASRVASTSASRTRTPASTGSASNSVYSRYRVSSNSTGGSSTGTSNGLSRTTRSRSALGSNSYSGSTGRAMSNVADGSDSVVERYTSNLRNRFLSGDQETSGGIRSPRSSSSTTTHSDSSSSSDRGSRSSSSTHSSGSLGSTRFAERIREANANSNSTLAKYGLTSGSGSSGSGYFGNANQPYSQNPDHLPVETNYEDYFQQETDRVVNGYTYL